MSMNAYDNRWEKAEEDIRLLEGYLAEEKEKSANYRSRIEVLERALSFYANEYNWAEHADYSGSYCRPIDNKTYLVAKQALEAREG